MYLTPGSPGTRRSENAPGRVLRPLYSVSDPIPPESYFTGVKRQPLTNMQVVWRCVTSSGSICTSWVRWS
jgi:hypothetical protein